MSTRTRRKDRDMARSLWRRAELVFLLAYATAFYVLILRTSLQLASDYSIGNKKGALRGLRLEKFWTHLNDVSDSQWRNFRQNLPILSLAMALLSLTNNTIRRSFSLQGKGTSCVLLAISLIYILYLHGACSLFLLAIAVGNFLLAKVMAGNPAFPALVWMYNLVFLVSNRVYEGYSFSYLGEELAFLDNHRGAQRWHISFNFGALLTHL